MSDTTYTVSGEIRGWKVTVRQGASRADIADMLATIDTLEKLSGGRQETPPADPRTTSGRPAAAGAAPSKDESGTYRVVRVEVGGLVDAADLRMFSDNPRLKFPVMTVPFSVFKTVMSEKYPEEAGWDLEQFNKPGVVFDVDWMVSWNRSPKNASWKDLSSIKALDWS